MTSGHRCQYPQCKHKATHINITSGIRMCVNHMWLWQQAQFHFEANPYGKKATVEELIEIEAETSIE